MSKKTNKRIIISVIALLVIFSCVLVACVPFGKDAPQGISEDTRTFKKIKDERMVAENTDYKGYIFKKGDSVMTFRLKSPTTIEENKKYPLIVFLHGMGDWGTDNSRHMYKSLIESVDKYVAEECYVFMPQTNKNYDWKGTHRKTGKKSEDIYNYCLDELIKTRAIDRDRVYITGMSMGGNGTLYQAYTHPEKYAAAVPLCGYFPDEEFSDLSRLSDIALWLAHSRTDDVVAFEESEKLYNRLVASGRTDIKTTWIDDYKHDITLPVYNNAELWQWMLEKSKIRE